MASYIPASVVSITIACTAMLIWLYGTTAYIKRQDFNNSNTESHGLIMPRAQSVDMVILGSSHGRVFSRHSNHRRIEDLLQCKILNLSRAGAGIVPMLMDLEWFFDLGNQTKVIIYFIDPWVLYSNVWNENNFSLNAYFFKEEPFSFDQAFRIFKYGGQKALEKYFRERLKIEWLRYAPVNYKAKNDQCLTRSDPDKVKRRLAFLYCESAKESNFRKYSAKLEEIAMLSATNKAKLIFIVPPTLLGKEPGHETTIAFLNSLRSKYAVPFFDFSQSIKDPRFFSDSDHLNAEGVIVFVREFLRPTLKLAGAACDWI